MKLGALGSMFLFSGREIGGIGSLVILSDRYAGVFVGCSISPSRVVPSRG